MKPSSCKAKGRRLQQQIVADLRRAFETQLDEDDLRSTGMGQHGEDVQLSAAARRLIPFSFEAKNVERVNLWQAWEQCATNCAPAHAPCVVLKRNHVAPLAVIEWTAFVDLLRRAAATTTDAPSSIPDQLRAIAARLDAAASTAEPMADERLE